MDSRTYTQPTDNKNRFLGFGLVLTEVGIMIGYGLAGNYRNDANGLSILRTDTISLILMFIFTIVGFGMLLNVYRFGNWLGSTSALMAAAISIQLGPLLQKFWFSVLVTGFGSKNTTVSGSSVQNFWRYYASSAIDESNMMMRTTLLSVISIMVVMSATVGRLNLNQIVKFTSIFQIFWNLNYYLLIWFLVVKNDHNSASALNPYFFDMFGTTYVYLFAAFFGLPFSCLLRKQKFPEIHPRNEFNRLSLLLSQIGTGFIIALFVFTSSYVIKYSYYGNSLGENVGRFSILFGMLGSIVGTYVGSAVVGRGRVGYKEALTGTITGGIVMGAAAPLTYNIGIVIMIGFVTGIICGIYMRTMHVKINKNNVKDTLGLFGPFTIASIIGSLIVLPSAVIVLYNRQHRFPFSTSSIPYSLAGYQLIYVGLSAGIGLGGGLLTALLSICDRDYFALASNSRVFLNQFGLYDPVEFVAVPQTTPTPTPDGQIPSHHIVKQPGSGNYLDQQHFDASDSQVHINKPASLI